MSCQTYKHMVLKSNSKHSIDKTLQDHGSKAHPKLPRFSLTHITNDQRTNNHLSKITGNTRKKLHCTSSNKRRNDNYCSFDQQLAILCNWVLGANSSCHWQSVLFANGALTELFSPSNANEAQYSSKQISSSINYSLHASNLLMFQADNNFRSIGYKSNYIMWGNFGLHQPTMLQMQQ